MASVSLNNTREALLLFALIALLICEKATANDNPRHFHKHPDQHPHPHRQLEEDEPLDEVDPEFQPPYLFGTEVVSEAEKLQIEREHQLWKEERGGCTRSYCPALNIFQEGATVSIDVYWHIIRPLDTYGGMTVGRVVDSIAFLNDAFRDTPFEFYILDITITDNDSWFNSALKGTQEEQEMKNALKVGNQEVLNIYSNNIYEDSSVTGYATFPWFYDGRNRLDGVVVDGGVCVDGDIDELDEGDVLVHYVGAWMGLYNVFEGGCEGTGDLVHDTPPQRIATFGCPDKQNSCPGGGRDSIHNYMDWSNNKCMREFTDGQIDRMISVYANFRTLTTPSPPTSPAPTPPDTTPRPTPEPTPQEPTTAAPTTLPTCFSEQATVPVQNQGPIAMPNLQTADKVLTADGYQTLYAFAHQDSQTNTEYLQFHTKQYPHNPLEISPRHLLFVMGRPNAVPAHSIRVGDALQSSQWENGVEVKKITTIHRNGMYAPLTLGGTIVVDGIVSSCYIALQNHEREHIELQGGISVGLSQHFIAHMAMSPIRMACIGISFELCQHYDQEGMAYFAKIGMEFAKLADEQSIVLQVVLLALYLLVFGLLYAVECLVGPTIGVLVMMAICAVCAAKLRGFLSTRKHPQAVKEKIE